MSLATASGERKKFRKQPLSELALPNEPPPSGKSTHLLIGGKGQYFRAATPPGQTAIAPYGPLRPRHRRDLVIAHGRAR